MTSAEAAEVLVRNSDTGVVLYDLVGLQKLKHANLIKTSHKDANNQLDEKKDDRETDNNEIPRRSPQKKRKERKCKKLKLLADYVESNNSPIDKCLIV